MTPFSRDLNHLKNFYSREIMTESFASTDQSGNIPFQGAYSNSDHNEHNNSSKQKRRQVQTTSQDVRYNPRPHQQQQQQQQQQWQPHYMHYNEYYSAPPPSRGGYYSNNHHQQRRGQQHRHPPPSSQVNQQITNRPNSNSAARSVNEGENLRSTLTEQLFKNIYECMICIIKIE
jgi:hypothetical protein